jgi:hypothetical protein
MLDETQDLIKKPRTKVEEEMMCGVQFPEHNKVQAAIEWHLAMLRQNHMTRCLPCHNGTANTPQTHFRCNGTGAPLPNRRSWQTPMPTPELTPSLPGQPPASTSHTSVAQCLKIINLLAGYAYSHISLPCAGSCILDSSAQDSEHHTNFDPDMLPDEGTSTG